MSDVGLSFSGNEKDLVRSVAKLEKANEDLRGQIRKLAKENRQAARDSKQDAKTHESNLDGVINKVSALATGYLSVQSAARLAGDEIRAVQERQSKAGMAQVTVAQAEQNMNRNMSGMAVADRRRFFGDMQQVAQDTKVPERFIFTAAGEALSASNQNMEMSRDAVKQAADFLKDTPEAISEYAGSLLDITKVTGWTDMAANQGFLSKVGASARIAKAEEQAMNIPPALISQMSYGATSNEAAALFGMITEMGGDKTGRRSGTAAVALAEQLKDFFQVISVKGDDALQKLDEVPKATAKAAKSQADMWKGFDTSAMTMGQRIEALWQSPELAQSFIAQASFEKKPGGVIKALLEQPQGAQAEGYLKRLGEYPDLQQAKAEGEATLAMRMLAPHEPTAMVQRTLEMATEQFQLADTSQGIAGVLRDQLPEMLSAKGESMLAQRMAKAEFEFGTSLGREKAIETATSMMGRRATELEATTDFIAPAGPGGAGTMVPRTPSERDLQTAEVLRAQMGALTEIRDYLKSIDNSSKTTAENSSKAAPAQDAAARFRPMTAPRGDRG